LVSLGAKDGPAGEPTDMTGERLTLSTTAGNARAFPEAMSGTLSEASLRHILRRARKQQGISQMELALRLGFSARHISFVEVGRARPSRTLIERWLEEVDAQPSVRSAALHHAGFSPGAGAPANNNCILPDPCLLERLLGVHDPFPAFYFDADWRIRSANRGATWLMSVIMPQYLRTVRPQGPVDMIDACVHPGGLLSLMSDASAVGYALLSQLELESAANPALRQRIKCLEVSLLDRFGRRPEGQITLAARSTFSFATHLGRLDFFRFQSLVDLPQDVTLRSIRVEVSLPLNEATKCAMQAASRTWPDRVSG
jgi:transcriptional regulator with XRE-family HTH domain